MWDELDHMDVNQVKWFDEEGEGLGVPTTSETKNEISFRFVDPKTFDEKGMGDSNFKTSHEQSGLKAEGVRFIIGKVK